MKFVNVNTSRDSALGENKWEEGKLETHLFSRRQHNSFQLRKTSTRNFRFKNHTQCHISSQMPYPLIFLLKAINYSIIMLARYEDSGENKDIDEKDDDEDLMQVTMMTMTMTECNNFWSTHPYPKKERNI